MNNPITSSSAFHHSYCPDNGVCNQSCFFIYSSPFCEESGKQIFLYLLSCEKNKMKHQAFFILCWLIPWLGWRIKMSHDLSSLLASLPINSTPSPDAILQNQNISISSLHLLTLFPSLIDINRSRAGPSFERLLNSIYFWAILQQFSSRITI